MEVALVHAHDAIDFRTNEVGSGTSHATGGTKIHVAQHSTAMSQRERAPRPGALLAQYVRSQPYTAKRASPKSATSLSKAAT